ncbi:hypothetical protein [Stutzerimonas xanthomarina]|uniref:hypothetical protein n=1 Tax=Stutzerimonas xanthomarina TaxID=271420 RepID=UPI003AA81B50
MNDIDWSKAPAWANVVICAELGAHFWASSWGGQKLAENIQTGATQYATMYGDHCWHLVASRHEAVWSGEGLPPVGAVCEYQVGGGTWYQCTVRYITKPISGDDVQVVIECVHLFGEQVAVPGNEIGQVTFRPIRTPEQIAAEEREKAIQQMIEDTNILTGIMSDRRIMAGQLYDAGYRRVEQ